MTKVDKTILFRICGICKTDFQTTHSQRKYCSRPCSKAAATRNNVWQTSQLGLPTGTVGAISELMVSIDLLRKGYEVFRSLSAHCSCDLAILKNGKLIRVEVRTGYENPVNGARAMGKKEHKADILAVVYPSEISYTPSLEEFDYSSNPM